MLPEGTPQAASLSLLRSRIHGLRRHGLAVAHNNIPLSEVIYVDASFTKTHPKKGENLNSA